MMKPVDTKNCEKICQTCINTSRKLSFCSIIYGSVLLFLVCSIGVSYYFVYDYTSELRTEITALQQDVSVTQKAFTSFLNKLQNGYNPGVKLDEDGKIRIRRDFDKKKDESYGDFDSLISQLSVENLLGSSLSSCKCENGSPGADGRPGLDGRPGFPGSKGENGPQGNPGVRGTDGVKGDPGIAGSPGAKGEPGERGVNGTPGAAGQKGDTGERGYVGPAGNPGPAGPAGRDGLRGDSGTPGVPGINGAKGEPGSPGTPGTSERGNSNFNIPSQYRSDSVNTLVNIQRSLEGVINSTTKLTTELNGSHSSSLYTDLAQTLAGLTSRITEVEGSVEELETTNRTPNCSSQTRTVTVNATPAPLTRGSVRLGQRREPALNRNWIAGHLEAYMNDRWGPVCDDGADGDDHSVAALNRIGQVVCRDLGGTLNEARNDLTISTAYFALDDLHCTGNEANLRYCRYNSPWTDNCARTEGVFVNCSITPTQLTVDGCSESGLTGNQRNNSSQSTGTQFIRWGSTECGSSADLIYEGDGMVTEDTSPHDGSAICMPNSPSSSGFSQFNSYSSSSQTSTLKRLLYLNPEGGFLARFPGSISCSLCHLKQHTSTYIQPVSTTCPTGWTRQYYGVLLSTFTDTICVQQSATDIVGRFSGLQLKPIKAGSNIYDGRYRNSYIKCAVCSR